MFGGSPAQPAAFAVLAVRTPVSQRQRRQRGAPATPRSGTPLAASQHAGTPQLDAADSPNLFTYHDPNQPAWWEDGSQEDEWRISCGSGPGTTGDRKGSGDEGCKRGGSAGSAAGAHPLLQLDGGAGAADSGEQLEDEESEEGEGEDFDEPPCDRHLYLEPPCLFPPGRPPRYELIDRLGQGAYASVWCAADLDSGCEVAIKVSVDHCAPCTFASAGEAARYRATVGVRAKCEEEFAVYRRLEAVGKGPSAAAAREHGIPTAYDAGTFEVPSSCGRGTNLCSWIALQLLGGSLEYGLRGAGGPVGREGCFAASSILARVGVRALKALSWIHGHGLIHRDVKPANMCTLHALPTEEGRRAYLVDYGFAQPSDPKILEEEPPCFYGTPLYASCATLRGALPCPRDDVEGLLYSLLAMGAPPDPSGRPIRNRLPFTVVMGSEAEGGPWSQRIMKVWADRKEAGWREAVAKGFIPLELDRCYQYLMTLGPCDPIDYDTLARLLSDMGRPPPPPPQQQQQPPPAKTADAEPQPAARGMKRGGAAAPRGGEKRTRMHDDAGVPFAIGGAAPPTSAGGWLGPAKGGPTAAELLAEGEE